MNIKIVTLKNGQIIICEFVRSNLIYLFRPLQMYTHQSDIGPTLAFIPFQEYSKEFLTGVPIKEEDILCITTPLDEVKEEYLKIFKKEI